ncbi:MAG: hypothetical protein R3C49_07855 [Planctomycetaceae bacterium]
MFPRFCGLVLLIPLQFLLFVDFAGADEPGGVELVIGGRTKAEGGDWDPAGSPLKRPFGLDFDPQERMVIVELEGGRVHRRDVDGSLTKISGDGSESFRGDGGPAADATYNGMHNCAVTKNGDIYIADSWNHRVRKIDGSTGTVSTIAGTGAAGYAGDGGPAVNAEFDFIMCISLTPAEDQLLVADLKNRRIRSIDLTSGVVRTIAGNGQKGTPTDGTPATQAPLQDPRAVAADSQGQVYVLERGGNALRVVRSDGTIHTVAGTGRRGDRDGSALKAEFGAPKHLCLDDQDRVYIADDENAVIRRYDPDTQKVTTILGRSHGDPHLKLSHPHGVCWQNGALYVVDSSQNRILKLQPQP